VQTQSDVSSFPQKSICDRRKVWWDSIARWTSILFSGPVPVLCRWYAAFRSFRGHIQFQFATSAVRVDLGPSVQFRNGYYRANARTLARAEGIEKLQATHRWVDIVDLQIFLMGFDAGEGYSKADRPVQDSSSSHNAHA
jgi:hypothetical protein